MQIDENAYEHEERRHEQEAHAHAEYPDACVICSTQLDDVEEEHWKDDGHQRIELNHNPARPNRWGWATTPLVAIRV